MATKNVHNVAAKNAHKNSRHSRIPGVHKLSRAEKILLFGAAFFAGEKAVSQTVESLKLNVPKEVTWEMLDTKEPYSKAMEDSVIARSIATAKYVNQQLRNLGFVRKVKTIQEAGALIDSAVNIRMNNFGTSLPRDTLEEGDSSKPAILGDNKYFKETMMTAESFLQPMDSAGFDCMDNALGLSDDIKLYGLDSSKILITWKKVTRSWAATMVNITDDFHAYIQVSTPDKEERVFDSMYGSAGETNERFRRSYDVLARLDPNKPDVIAHIQAGDYFRAHGKYEDAAKQYKMALEADATNAAFYNYKLAFMFNHMKHYDEALKCIDSAIAAMPKQPQFRWRRAIINEERGKLAEALEDYKFGNQTPITVLSQYFIYGKLGDINGQYKTLLKFHKDFPEFAATMPEYKQVLESLQKELADAKTKNGEANKTQANAK